MGLMISLSPKCFVDLLLIEVWMRETLEIMLFFVDAVEPVRWWVLEGLGCSITMVTRLLFAIHPQRDRELASLSSMNRVCP